MTNEPRIFSLDLVNIRYEEHDKYKVFIQIGIERKKDDDSDEDTMKVLATVASNSFYANLKAGKDYEIMLTMPLAEIMTTLKVCDGEEVDRLFEAK